jgi:hypothetical protein
MTKRKSLNNSLTDRFSRKNSRRRKEGIKNLRVFFLIVCEGEKTEPNYFKSFPFQVKDFVFDLQFGGGGISTVKVVDEAIRLRDKSSIQFDRVWAVFDKDSFSDENFNTAIFKGEQNGVNCAWSNEAFELWYILHFQYRNTPMPRNEYESAISAIVNDIQGSKTYRYAKNAGDMYDVLQQYGDEDAAIRNAKRLYESYSDTAYAQHNPCTTVYKLVEELRGKCEKFNQEIKEKYEKGE